MLSVDDAPGGVLLPAILFSAFVAIFVIGTRFAPPAQGETAIIFAPGTPEAEVWTKVAAAGGFVVGPTNLPFAYVAYAPDQSFAWTMLLQGGLPISTDTRICRPDFSPENII